VDCWNYDVLSRLFEIGHTELLTALGAVSALIILIFRDIILGFGQCQSVYK
jgi:miniconductance mechanosensitive channel